MFSVGKMTDTANSDIQESTDHDTGTPLCLRCLRPADPRTYYCPHCGEATGQLTPLIPFVEIAWETRIWGQMWRQIWSREVSIPGRLFRLFMVLWCVPILLVGLLFRPWRKTEATEPASTSGQDHDEGPDV
jgi:hypothetical protein